MSDDCDAELAALASQAAAQPGDIERESDVKAAAMLEQVKRWRAAEALAGRAFAPEGAAAAELDDDPTPDAKSPVQPNGRMRDGKSPANGMAVQDYAVEVHWHGEADDTPLKEWLVDRTLPKVGTALLAGQWGLFKTFIALDLAVAAMTRSDFAGRRVDRQGGTLFIALEGQGDIRLRIQGVINEKVSSAAKGEADDAKPIDAAHAPFAWIESCPTLSSLDALPQLRKIIAGVAAEMDKRSGLPLALVLIDTFSPAAGLRDANDTAENQRVMGVLTAIAIEFRLLVTAVDHFGKDASTGTRNSSVKEASVDAVLAALGDRDLAGNVSNQRLAIRKVRGAPTGEEIPFETRSVVVHENLGFDAVTTLVVDWSRKATNIGIAGGKTKKWPKALVIFKKALDAALVDAGRKTRPFADGPEVLAVDREKVRDEFFKIYPADNIKAKGQAFRRCEQDAVAGQMMAAREVGPVEKAATIFWLLVARG